MYVSRSNSLQNAVGTDTLAPPSSVVAVRHQHCNWEITKTSNIAFPWKQKTHKKKTDTRDDSFLMFSHDVTLLFSFFFLKREKNLMCCLADGSLLFCGIFMTRLHRGVRPATLFNAVICKYCTLQEKKCIIVKIIVPCKYVAVPEPFERAERAKYFIQFLILSYYNCLFFFFFHTNIFCKVLRWHR